METDPVSHLGRLLSSAGTERALSRSDFALAKKVIVFFKIPDEDVAKFLFRHAMTAIRAAAGTVPLFLPCHELAIFFTIFCPCATKTSHVVITTFAFA